MARRNNRRDDSGPENAERADDTGSDAETADPFDELIAGAISDAAATEADAPGADVVVFETATDVATGEEATGDVETAKPQDNKAARAAGWKRIFTGNKPLWITTAVALGALGIGTALGTFVLSPGGASDAVPDAGLITVPVTYGELSNDVTIRADVGFSDPVPLKFDAGSGGGVAVVTGRVPEVGAAVARGDVLLEIVDRPVIVLPGELPAYRTLSMGMRGGDVVQLRQALTDWDIAAGDLGSNLYDQALADGVAAMYERIGYSAPTAGPEAQEAFRQAQRAATEAETAFNQAVAMRDQAASGPSNAQIVAAENQIEAAQEAWQMAKDAGDQAGMNAANRMIQEAKAQYYALWDIDTSGEQAQVDGAWTQREQAYEQLEQARQGIQPIMPSNEIIYLTELPRRVDAVNVSRGSILDSNPAVVVSGATIKLTGSVPEADAAHLQVGSVGTFEVDGAQLTATVTALSAPASGQTRWPIELAPDELTPEQYQRVQGSNVPVVMQIGATDGKVLSVPASALTAGPGGEYRVQVVDGDPRDGDRAETRLVQVETGLAARGQVEVRPVAGELREGDLVVVGR